MITQFTMTTCKSAVAQASSQLPTAVRLVLTPVFNVLCDKLVKYEGPALTKACEAELSPYESSLNAMGYSAKSVCSALISGDSGGVSSAPFNCATACPSGYAPVLDSGKMLCVDKNTPLELILANGQTDMCKAFSMASAKNAVALEPTYGGSILVRDLSNVKLVSPVQQASVTLPSAPTAKVKQAAPMSTGAKVVIGAGVAAGAVYLLTKLF